MQQLLFSIRMGHFSGENIGAARSRCEEHSVAIVPQLKRIPPSIILDELCSVHKTMAVLEIESFIGMWWVQGLNISWEACQKISLLRNSTNFLFW